MESKTVTIVWFRQDLRVSDHPALHAAIKKGGPILPVFIWAQEEEGKWPYGGASKWWLHFSLKSLQADLENLGLNLVIRSGETLKVLKQLINESGADAVFWHRRYEPYSIARDAKIKSELHHEGINAQSFNGSLLFEPWTIANKQNKPFQVFTPFWNCCKQKGEISKPLDKPKGPLKGVQVKSDILESLDLLPHIQWDNGLREEWIPGESGAHKRLKEFIKDPVKEYLEQRDRPDIHGTSKLSPHLHFGEITSRMIWHEVLEKDYQEKDVEGYLRQLGWREFGHHLLYHFPFTPEKPLREDFSKFPWRTNEKHLKAWQKGLTGYPIVDAGMRELWHTGWMHNRVRMIVGSFLVKDLLLPWQDGEKWFWDTLVDADLANNTLGWQWIGGCGADAAPYFRIFNPITQGEKFDPEGEYIRKWIPELKAIPNKWIHQPWNAPRDMFYDTTYPEPIVDHSKARLDALAAFDQIKGSRA